MANAQNKRLMIARFLGVPRTVEQHTPPGEKRIEDAKRYVMGDGNSNVEYLHDPAWEIKPVTLRMIAQKDDPWVAALALAKRRHKDDPSSAEPVLLLSYKDSGAVNGTKTLIKSVLQDISYPEGDTGSSDLVMVEMIVQPHAML